MFTNLALFGLRCRNDSRLVGDSTQPSPLFIPGIQGDLGKLRDFRGVQGGIVGG